jgi:hypothetical protein
MILDTARIITKEVTEAMNKTPHGQADSSPQCTMVLYKPSTANVAYKKSTRIVISSQKYYIDAVALNHPMHYVPHNLDKAALDSSLLGLY